MGLGELKRRPPAGWEVKFKVNGAHVTLSERIPKINAFLCGVCPGLGGGRQGGFSAEMEECWFR